MVPYEFIAYLVERYYLQPLMKDIANQCLKQTASPVEGYCKPRQKRL